MTICSEAERWKRIADSYSAATSAGEFLPNRFDLGIFPNLRILRDNSHSLHHGRGDCAFNLDLDTVIASPNHSPITMGIYFNSAGFSRGEAPWLDFKGD